ncbi:MAG: hypothetical protein U9N14_03230 [Pseudomonadota bacterium]|nr:hypothetical protein [Pseudomonadota bacterium]
MNKPVSDPLDPARVLRRLKSLGCDPIEGMARIAADPETPVELRARLYRDLLQVILAGKGKAVAKDAVELAEPIRFIFESRAP